MRDTEEIVHVLLSDHSHPVCRHLKEWVADRGGESTKLLSRGSECTGGDFLFLISCHEIIPKKIRSSYRFCLVSHASDLPQGRGWSPHVWQILEGRREIVVSLIEAESGVDTGDIWLQVVVDVEPTALFKEICNTISKAQVTLIDRAVKEFEDITPRRQRSKKATYYPRRSPSDSQLDPCKSIADQFDLIRVSDPVRYPAFFEYRGQKYKVLLEKLDS